MPAAAFAHVLDRLIDGAGPSSTAVTAGILTSPLVAAPFAGRHSSMLPRTTPVIAPVRPRRRLTSAQARALELLRRAGADLHPDYFASELKSAFRRLARQLHPDRHPQADAAARAALSAAFREVREAYGALPL